MSQAACATQPPRAVAQQHRHPLRWGVDHAAIDSSRTTLAPQHPEPQDPAEHSPQGVGRDARTWFLFGTDEDQRLPERFIITGGHQPGFDRCDRPARRVTLSEQDQRVGSMTRKIAIVGAGAVGGYAGAHMVRAGEDVTFLDPWPEHVEAMRKRGLRVTHARDVPEFSIAVRALHITDAQRLSKETPIDIAFICVKSYDTAWATTLIGQYLAPNGYVVSLQNCMNEETIAAIVGWGKTLGCIDRLITVNTPEPGHIHRGAGKHGAAHTVSRAGEVHGPITRRAEEICRLVGAADSAKVTENLWGERWS